MASPVVAPSQIFVEDEPSAAAAAVPRAVAVSEEPKAPCIRFSIFHMSFDTPELENAYRLHFAHQQLSSDIAWTIITALMGFLFLRKLGTDHIVGSLYEQAVYFFNATIYLGLPLVIFYLGFLQREQYANWRARILMFARIHRALSIHQTARRHKLRKNSFALITPSSPLAQVLATMFTEFMFFLASSLGYQFISYQQSIVGAAFASFSIYTYLSFTCVNLQTESPAVHQAYITLANWLSGMYDRLLPMTKPNGRAVTVLSCFGVRLWSTATLGIALPLFVGSIFEERSRYKFLQQWGAPRSLKSGIVWSAVHAVAVTLLFGGFVWVLLQGLGILASSRGWASLQWVL